MYEIEYSDVLSTSVIPTSRSDVWEIYLTDGGDQRVSVQISPGQAIGLAQQIAGCAVRQLEVVTQELSRWVEAG